MSWLGKSEKPSAKVIPVVDLKGVIQAGGRSSFMSSGGKINIDGMRESLTKAFNTAGAVAVALDINSPGGSPTQSELVASLIRELAEEKNIPVYAFAQDVAASGGYWLACAADEIFAAKTSTIGSIGVVTSGMGYAGLAQKLGIEDRTFTAGEAKRRMSPMKDVKPEDEKWITDRLEKMHVLFKDWIMERRGDKLIVPDGQDKDKYLDANVFTGDTWYGQESVDMGLIDGIGHMETVLKEKFGDDVKIERTAPKRKGLLSSLLPFNMSAQAAESSSIGAEAVKAAAEIMQNEVIWQRYDMR